MKYRSTLAALVFLLGACAGNTAREELPKETWLAAQAYWLKRMADEALRPEGGSLMLRNLNRGDPAVIAIGHDLWHSEFGGRSDVQT